MTELKALTVEAARQAIAWYVEPVRTLWMLALGRRVRIPSRPIDNGETSEHDEELSIGAPTEREESDAHLRSERNGENLPDSSVRRGGKHTPLLEPAPPRVTVVAIEEHPNFERLAFEKLTRAQVHGLMLLLVRLRFVAGDIEPFDASGIRELSLRSTILLENGEEIAPVAVYFVLTHDGRTAQIIDVQGVPSERVEVARGGLQDVILATALASSQLHDVQEGGVS